MYERARAYDVKQGGNEASCDECERAQVLEPLESRLRMRIDEAHAQLEPSSSGNQHGEDARGILGGVPAAHDAGCAWPSQSCVMSMSSPEAAGRAAKGLENAAGSVGEAGAYAREMGRMQEELDQRMNSRVFVTCKLALRQLESVVSLARQRAREVREGKAG